MVEKNLAAVELGHLGGLKGGKARAAILSREQRREIAQIAARARWKPIPLACPYCHKINYHFEELEENAWFVYCDNCDVLGPEGKDKDEAVKRWNGYEETK